MKILTFCSSFALLGLLAGQALAQAPVITYATSEDFAYLNFVAPSGKAPAMKFACAKGMGRVDIAQYEAQPVDQPLALSSGNESGVLEAKKMTGSHGDFVRAQIFAIDKIMNRFRESGQLELSGQGFHDRIAATDDGKHQIEQFFISCEEG
jgi:hypothetical protein